MNVSEKASCVRGLLDGLELDAGAKETKVLNAMSELLEEMGQKIEELDGQQNEFLRIIDELDFSLGELEEEVYGGDDCCGCGHHHEFDDEIEVACPKCGELIELTDEMLEMDSINCPKCGETLEFDFGDDEDEDE